MKATILFATYNGERTLPRMLESLSRQTLPFSDWKIVAVDNASTDGTTDILKSWQHRLPLEIHTQAKQGKAAALDMGFQYLAGNLVILTDDDVIPDPDWLESWLKVADEKKDYDLFGGLILPEWESSPPSWITQWVHLGVAYALNDELAEGPIPAHLISGPNSAFRRSALPEKFTVIEGQGPSAQNKQYAMGEDTLFARSLEIKGHKAFFTRQAVVRHIIKSEYIQEKWILQRAERYGKGRPLVRPELFKKYPLKTLIKSFLLTIIAPMATIIPRSSLRFRLLWNHHYVRGILKTLYLFKNSR